MQQSIFSPCWTQHQHQALPPINLRPYTMTMQPVATLIHQPDNTIIQALDNIIHFFHCTPSDLVGKTLDELECYFIHKDGRQLSREEHPVQRTLKSKSYKHTTIHTTTHNATQTTSQTTTLGIYSEKYLSLIWAEVESYPEFDVNGDIVHIVTIYRDTTEVIQKSIAEALSHKIKDEWEKTFDALQDVVTILSPDLVVIRANKATYTTFGITRGQLIGRRCYEVFHGKTEPCERCPVRFPQVEAAVETELIHNQRLDKTFEVTSSAVFDDDGILKYLVHTARDITRELKDEEERNILSAAVEQTTESVVITDVEGNIQYVNPSYAETTGYSRQEMLGKNVDFLHADTNSAHLFIGILDTLKAGGTWQGRLTSCKQDGSRFEETATISPITQGDGKISNFVAVKRDISKEIQLQRQLQQAMKMEAIGTLAGGIAHDFNNILSAMIGYGQIAKGRLDQGDPLHGDIEQILLAGDRAANLVKQILTFSRRDTQENFYPLKVQYIIKEVMELLRSSFPSTIQLRQLIDKSCSPILADPGQLHQLIMNLCTNAKQAIAGGYGILHISLQEITITEPQLLGSSLLTSGDYVHLFVQDNGCGMNEETQQRIFDPFFTTKTRDQGTGLGLSVVLGIVEKHGGVLTVDSTEDVGTTFHLYFPVVRQDIRTDEEIVEPDNLGTERIMVVDDEVVLSRIMERMLSRLGYTVKRYTDSLKAVHDFRQAPYDVDLIITDMTMPNMTGAELAREVLSFRPELPIIMTTGYSEIIDEEKAALLGIRTFMLKPVKKKSLLQMVRKVLDDATNSCN